MNDVSCLIFVVSAAVGVDAGHGQSTGPSEASPPDLRQRSDEVAAIALRGQAARSRAAWLGRKHPQYESVQRRLAELERDLKMLKDGSTVSERPEGPPTDTYSPSDPLAGTVETKTESEDPESNTIGAAASERLITKPLLTARQLKPLGGWRLPATGSGGKGLGYSRGGLYVEHGEGAVRMLYVYGHQQATECHL